MVDFKQNAERQHYIQVDYDHRRLDSFLFRAAATCSNIAIGSLISLLMTGCCTVVKLI
jgi:hypothetical protein